MWKRVGVVLLSLAVSGLFLWLALRDVPLNDVWESIKQANLFWAAMTVVVGVLGIYTRAIRWRGLVDNQITTARSFYIVGIMQFMNVLPLRAGEVGRTVLAARERIPIVTTASSIIVERLLDLVVVLGMLAVVVPQVDTLPASVSRSVATFGGLAVIGFAVLIILARYPDFARGVLDWFQWRIPALDRLPLESLLDNALDGLKPLVDARRFAFALGWTVVSWAFSWGMFYTGQLALGIPATELLFTTMCIALAAFAVAVPVTVAAVGPFQAAVIVAGTAFGIDEVLATALGFLVHGGTILTYVIAGTWGFLGMGVSLGEMVKRADPPVDAGTGDASTA